LYILTVKKVCIVGEELTELELVDLCKDVPGDEEASKIYAIPL
jgi:hypothetical protein